MGDVNKLQKFVDNAKNVLPQATFEFSLKVWVMG